MKVLLLLPVAICAAFCQPAVQQAPPAQLPENVIHINVNLVQVDATVTGKSGKPVKNLKPEDFEILQDGKPQPITNFTYIDVHPGADAAPAPTPVKTKSKPIPPPPLNLKPGDIRRTVALVVDDLGLSFESISHVRDALKRFVDREMQPGDLVAVIRTGAGMGSLQQFTSDKRILYAAIDHVKYNSFGRVGTSSFAPLGNAEESDAERNSIFAAGTLGAIRFVVNGLRELPGRKAVLLFSENLTLFQGHEADERVLEGIRRLVDSANRASVVFYSIDPRGVVITSLRAADDTSRLKGSPAEIAQQLSQIPSQRSQQVFESQGGLVYLADETGGKFYHNTNDLNDSVRKAVSDSEGYYLLAYHPSASTFDAKTGQPKFHNVRVRLREAAGLTVRSRRGFFGKSDELHEPPPRNQREQIQRALYSPFNSGAIHTRLTTLFSNTALEGSYLNSYLHIDVKDLQFTDEADGWKKAVFDVAAVTFGENGEAVDSTGRTYTIRLRGETYEKVLQDGFFYQFRHPVKKPGFYQLRVALLDDGNRQVGSANQFIEVPDVNKALTLSSLILGKQLAVPTGDGQQPQPDPKANGILRTFKQGDALQYAYQVLDMRAEPNKPQDLQVQTRIFRDGKPIFEGPPRPLKAGDSNDAKRALAGGAIQLGAALKPGDYVLQVIVSAKEGDKQRAAAQSMDFEIEPAPSAAH
jgi:VWFA-related protein